MSEMSRFSCPQCGLRMKAAAKSANKSLRCQRCGTRMRVPAPSDDPKVYPAAERFAPRSETVPLAASWNVWIGFGGVAVAAAVAATVWLAMSLSRSTTEQPVAAAPPTAPPERGLAFPKLSPQPAPPQESPQNSSLDDNALKDFFLKSPKKEDAPASPPMPMPEPAPPKVETVDPPAEKALPEPDPELPVAGNEFQADKKLPRLGMEILVLREGELTYYVRRLKETNESKNRGLKIAVSPSGSDNMAIVLRDLKIPFDNLILRGEDWTADRLQAYDVIFLNCGGTPGQPAEQAALRYYVERGGTLYASDLQYNNIRSTFIPSRANPRPFDGDTQTLNAQVVDSRLRAYLGASEIKLTFNADGWQLANFEVEKLTTYLTGRPKGFREGNAFDPAGPFGGGKMLKTVNPEMPPLDEEKAKTQKSALVPTPTPEQPTVRQAYLTAQDPRYKTTNTPYKVFDVKVKRGSSYQIDLMSNEFDALLGILNRNSGALITQDDDGGLGQNARLVYTPTADQDIRLLATSVGGGTGHFAIQITEISSGAKKDLPVGSANLPRDGSMPLLTSFPAGQGRVIFTSFHNSAQVNGIEKKLLEFLVFSSLTARADDRIAAVLKALDFQKHYLRTIRLSANAGTDKETYRHEGGSLQVLVGFEPVGAKLKLTLTSPTGQRIERTESAMFLIEVPNAAPGVWEYRISAEAVPFPNFPFSVGLARAQPTK